MDNRQSDFSWTLFAPFFVAMVAYFGYGTFVEGPPLDPVQTVFRAVFLLPVSFVAAVVLFIATVPPFAWIYQARLDGKSWAGAVWSVVKWGPIAFVLAVGAWGLFSAVNMVLHKLYWLGLLVGVLVMLSVPFTLVSLWKDEAFRSKLNTFDAAKNKRLD